MFKIVEKVKNREYSKEKGFSLLELSVAVGIAAVIAAVAITATTVFVNGAADSAELYETAADQSIANAEASFDALWGESGAPGGIVSVPGQPVGVNVASETITPTGALIAWGAPTTGTVDSYTVEWVNQTTGTVEGSITGLPNTVTEYSITGLTADSSYEARVIAVSPDGTSGDVASINFTTDNFPELTLAYTNTSFTVGSNNQTITPATTGGDPTSTKTYSVDGTLPDGVTFNETTGVFTGPADSAWNFTATQIGTGNRHTCAVTTSGGVKCWGSNTVGQLGNGTTTDSSTPVDVVGLTSGVASITAGWAHNCAVNTNGGAKCWGSNTNGRLGDGTTTQRSTPVDVSGLTSGVASISAFNIHTCAVTTSGGVKCWGANGSGRLGDGTTTDSSTPVDVVGLTSGVASISAGGNHTCAVTTSGGAKCWGSNSNGRLGDGTTTDSSTPVDVVGLTSGVASISAGSAHTCAVTTSGGAKCWGSNTNGRLGDGTTTTRRTPVDVVGLTSGVASISAGSEHTCAVTTSGGAKCWGNNRTVVQSFGFVISSTIDGRLGVGAINSSSTPVDVSGFEPQPGFPATVEVTVSDSSGSKSESLTLTVG